MRRLLQNASFLQNDAEQRPFQWKLHAGDVKKVILLFNKFNCYNDVKPSIIQCALKMALESSGFC